MVGSCVDGVCPGTRPLAGGPGGSGTPQASGQLWP